MALSERHEVGQAFQMQENKCVQMPLENAMESYAC